MAALRFILVLVVLAAGGCTRTPSDEVATKTTPEKEAPPSVAVAKVERVNLVNTVALAAEFHPQQEADLHAKVAGYLRTIGVDIGSVVKQGQVLATLEAPELVREVEQAQASEKRVKLDVDRARSDVERADSAFRIRELSYKRFSAIASQRPNLVAQQEIDDITAKFQEAQAQLGAARANLAALEQQVQVAESARAKAEAMLEYTKIVAPFNGVVTRRYADPGAMIQAGTSSHSQARPVVRLSQLDKLRLSVPIPVSLAPSVGPGQNVEIRVDVLKRVFSGTVARASGSVEAATRTMDAQIDVPNADYILKPGMFAQVIFPVNRLNRAVAVPLRSVIDRQGPVVLAISGANEVEERRIEKGFETAEQVEVLSGISAGDLVVIAGAAQLKAGQRVTPKLLSGGVR
jgi:RND family efflux transporter MFP subunit